MKQKRQILIGLTLLILIGCSQTNKPHEKPFDKKAQTLTINFSKSIFSKEKINSKEILDTLNILSDTIFVDTAKYNRAPKATIYANNSAKTYFQVFENPKGIITAIAFFKNRTEINVAEYFNNGQVMCSFKVTDEGIRDGKFICYYEDGKYRRTGYYKNGTEVNDSSKTYNDQ
jgi:antitoxin component YwqK of YwqJK toxin-antitoxin module